MSKDAKLNLLRHWINTISGDCDGDHIAALEGDKASHVKVEISSRESMIKMMLGILLAVRQSAKKNEDINIETWAEHCIEVLTRITGVHYEHPPSGKAPPLQ